MILPRQRRLCTLKRRRNPNASLVWKNPSATSSWRNESIAPCRTLRVFPYILALLGVIITLTGAITATGKEGVDINTEYLNLVIDFGAVAIFALLFKFDTAKGEELNEEVEKKVERRRRRNNSTNNLEAYLEKRFNKYLVLRCNNGVISSRPVLGGS